MANKYQPLSIRRELPGREEEIELISDFVREKLNSREGGSIYISGPPGTGKTAVMKHVIDALTEELDFEHIIINCMSFKGTAEVFKEMGSRLRVVKKDEVLDTVELKKRISARFLSKSALLKMRVIFLDEMDQLLNRNEENVLKNLFELANKTESKVVLIGISNSLDLTSRHLANISSSPLTKTLAKKKGAKNVKINKDIKLIKFLPYKKDEIEKILVSTLQEVKIKENFDPIAIKFVAAKVAATTGDIRKALNACKEALRHKRPASNDGMLVLSPKKFCGENDQVERIGIKSVSKLLFADKEEDDFPLQQKLVLATLMKMNKDAEFKKGTFDGVKSPVPSDALYDEYRRICGKQGYSWIERSDLLSICGLLQNRDMLSVVTKSPSGKAKFGSRVSTGIVFDPVKTHLLLRNNDCITSIY